MDESLDAVTAEAVAVLRRAGARFGYLHGSRASNGFRPDSDIDVAAYFRGGPPSAFEVLLPAGVDLLVLDDAPLELAGRVAVGGRLLWRRIATGLRPIALNPAQNTRGSLRRSCALLLTAK